MTSVRASYLPGDWVAVSAPNTWLLVSLRPDHPTVTRCWELMAAGRGVDDLLDALLSSGVRGMPPFALLHLGDDERRAIVRGQAHIEVTAADGVASMQSAPEHAPWWDEPVDDLVEAVRLTGGSAGSGVALPMSAGVTMAAGISVRTGGGETAAPSPFDVDVAAAPRPPDAVAADVFGAAEPQAESQPEPQPESEPDVEAPSYDFLFGATQRPPAAEQQPAPPADDADAEPSTASATASSETAGWHTISGTLGLAEPEQVPEASAGGLIDGLPWAPPPPPPGFGAPEPAAVDAPRWTPPSADPAQTSWTPPPPQPIVPTAVNQPPVLDQPPDLVAQTVDRAALRATLGSAAVAGPTVLAGRCPAGHLSPPHAASCRVCGAPMLAQQAFEIPRPSLGVLRLSSGDVVNLDRGVLLGRAPSSSANADRPHLVRLASPENDISRNHAEVVIDGWHVYVRDLGSTNGTTVTLPGQQPVRLRENDLQLLERGAVITLADEVSATFEVSG